MPLFECSKCKAIDNTATGDYWHRVFGENLPPLCSECDEGTWHGMFPKQTAAEIGLERGEDGFFRKPKSA